MGKIVIDPVTRIEGHLKVEAIVENGEVKDARTTGNLFRGLERDLRTALSYARRSDATRTIRANGSCGACRTRC